MTERRLTVREEELQIEIERLKGWLNFIENEAWKETPLSIIEAMAGDAIKHSSCVVHPDWTSTKDWAAIGLWPRKAEHYQEREATDD